MKKRTSHRLAATRTRAKVKSLPVQGSRRQEVRVVAVGASAGGLGAFKKFLDALPVDSGMAVILVQHLDPSHKSVMADLLAAHTSMAVRQATDGMQLERNHVYVIPPGTYLSVENGALRLSQPPSRRGVRLPFDFLLQALAREYGAQTSCVILSGTGADGSIGLKAVKDAGGLVIAQDPGEAEYDGMPRSAIATGAVDLVLPVATIARTLVDPAGERRSAARSENSPDWLDKIIEYLRTEGTRDFQPYKKGTLQRRIERRMAMASIGSHDADRYVEVLRTDGTELDALVKDLLINVTSFFRDTKVFDLLETKIVPDLIRNHSADRTLRIWVPGCSSGEEAYSLAMLFLEQVAAIRPGLRLQVFASDADPDAVASARLGVFPEAALENVSPARRARFFSKTDDGYRVLPELRATTVFTVHDLLVDPPFSRLDMVSCRNLLIYLDREAQERVIGLFHFGLRDGGMLLLGTSETVVNVVDRFEVVSKPERIYRRIGRNRRANPAFFGGSRTGARPPSRIQAAARQAILGDLCRRMAAEIYAPATVLINRKLECLYYLGPIDDYLKVPLGEPVHDLLASARDGVADGLKSVIKRAFRENTRVSIFGSRAKRGSNGQHFSIVAQPLSTGEEQMLLISFIEETEGTSKQGSSNSPQPGTRAAQLERQLGTMRKELDSIVRSRDVANDTQKTINEELLSVNEEYQSTNEELLTSKEELQSLNEELTSLNNQLQETLERQRTTTDDLNNVLSSTNIATLFLDVDLNIRFFTPTTRSLFSVIPTDIGRPIADLRSLSADDSLVSDARAVLQTLEPIEREIESENHVWYLRRTTPYRTQDKLIEGVVITFTDSTERRHAAEALEMAKQQAQLANLTKSRFLAVASHDLRQPLQTLALLHEMLARSVDGEKPQQLVSRLGETLTAMSRILNTLLDINQIEAGVIRAEIADFPIQDLLERLRNEFTYHAQERGLALHLVKCGLTIRSDPRLLEQMMRNLLSNAIKHTKHGEVLLGCRRREGKLSIEFWDTGVGIPDEARQSIFEEYYQLDNPAHEASRGLGLGLSIVQRLANLLGHPIRVHSQLGKGSVFAIEVDIVSDGPSAPSRHDADDDTTVRTRRSSVILIVEDDDDVRELLQLHLEQEGYRTAATPDGVAALELVTRQAIRPDLILADLNLPNGMNGLQVAARLREQFRRPIPVIVLTGDISTRAIREVALQDCVRFSKPVDVKELTQAIHRLLPLLHVPSIAQDPPPPGASHPPRSPKILVVDDDPQIPEALRAVLEDDGFVVESYPTGEAFLKAFRPDGEACLLIDAYLPGMDGIELLQRIRDARLQLPAIMITGRGDVQLAVQAMRCGAVDFIEKPIGRVALLESVKRALAQSPDQGKLLALREKAAKRIAMLTPRQQEIMKLVLAGRPSKNIAADLGISQRTVENHRAVIMKKTGSKSLPALARLALAAEDIRTPEPVS